jgi:hypothetical protein
MDNHQRSAERARLQASSELRLPYSRSIVPECLSDTRACRALLAHRAALYGSLLNPVCKGISALYSSDPKRHGHVVAMVARDDYACGSVCRIL